MNSVTDALKRNMAQRHSQPTNYLRPESKAPPTKKQDIFQQKFMQHFQTINKTNTYNRQESPQNQPITYQKVMIDYSSKSSHIDGILSYDEDAIHLAYNQLHFAVPPIVPVLKKKASSLEAINTINDIFAGKEEKQNKMGESNSLMVIEYYSQILKDLGRREKPKDIKPTKQREFSKSPTYQHIQMKEVQTESRNVTDSKNSEENESKVFQKTSRKDLILMELIRQKKRKNFAPDYFAIMEMKLMELLEFILEDQPQYIGLDPHTKVRQVLKNLESFQGKMVEGQSKINLLRIFFEEFTNLKRQKDQVQAIKTYTPMKGLENRDKTPAATSAKFRTTKDTFKQSRQTNKETTPYRKPTKSKKETTINWIQNQKQQAKGSKGRRGSDSKGDEWIGSL